MLRRAAASVALVLALLSPAFAAGEASPKPAPGPAAPAPAVTAPAAPAAPAAPGAAAPATPAPPAAQAPDAPKAPDALKPPAAADQEPKPDKTLPQIGYGEEGLPDKVRDMRRRIIAAAKTGDLEALRPVLESNEVPPALSGGDSDDPIATLKLLSGDDKGREILAILLDVMESGYAHVDVGTPQDMYVWPYFSRFPLDKLSGPQMVELFRLITAGDFQDMQDKGVYSFYRVGIGPDGTWHFFEDGD